MLRIIRSQSGAGVLFTDKCRCIYTTVKADGDKLIYADFGSEHDLKLGTYKSLDHVRSVIDAIINCDDDVFEMPGDDAEWLNVQARGSAAAKAKHKNTRHGGS